MNAPSRLVKSATLCSSLLLLVGFVGCHSGALNWFKKDRPEPSNLVNDSSSNGSSTPTIMNSTKSMGPSRPIEGLTPAKRHTDPDIPSRVIE